MKINKYKAHLRNKVTNDTKTYYIDDAIKLDEVQKLVKGYIEIVYSDEEIQIICNEEGRILNQPYNAEATMVWNWCKLFSNPNAIKDVVLLGDVVVLSKKALLD